MASQSMKCLTLTATALLLCGTAQPVLAQGMDLGTLVLDTFEDGNTESPPRTPIPAPPPAPRFRCA